uniref:Uncharacterized protein n=1 Tax=Tremella fuciformis TaxID=64657 RepID=D5KY07_9TREE|nr:unknown [Tremella fuciformis]
MARGRAAAPGSDKPKERHPVHFNLIFRSARQITYFVLFTLWICLSIVELGLVSQQIHRFGGRFRSDWPTQEYGHAMGLLLFTSIISLLFGLFHWALSLFLYLPIFLAMGVWWGTGAGIFESTPFGHGLQCGNPTASFPAAYQPYVSQCSRVTAIEGLAWAMCKPPLSAVSRRNTDRQSRWLSSACSSPLSTSSASTAGATTSTTSSLTRRRSPSTAHQRREPLPSVSSQHLETRRRNGDRAEETVSIQ